MRTAQIVKPSGKPHAHHTPPGQAETRSSAPLVLIPDSRKAKRTPPDLGVRAFVNSPQWKKQAIRPVSILDRLGRRYSPELLNVALQAEIALLDRNPHEFA